MSPLDRKNDQVPIHHIVGTIVSGGQAGADRAALDWVMKSGHRHGGWCPKGRSAEDGVIDAKYLLKETESAGYRQRTRFNVTDSDGTLIVNLGQRDGGSRATRQVAEKLGRPVLVAQMDFGLAEDLVLQVIEWVRAHHIITLNVAGPRESKRPGIYRLTWDLLEAVAIVTAQQSREHDDQD